MSFTQIVSPARIVSLTILDQREDITAVTWHSRGEVPCRCTQCDELDNWSSDGLASRVHRLGTPISINQFLRTEVLTFACQKKCQRRTKMSTSSLTLLTPAVVASTLKLALLSGRSDVFIRRGHRGRGRCCYVAVPSAFTAFTTRPNTLYSRNEGGAHCAQTRHGTYG